MIHFRCSSCNQLMSVRPEFAGRSGNCPSCGSPFTTPPRSTCDPNAAAAPPPPQPSAPPPMPAPPPASVSGRCQLEVVHGPAGFQGRTFPINCVRPATLGRDPAADLRIPSERVSRRHCQIQASPQGYVLIDLGSSNGTLLNQSRIQGSQALSPGDYIQTGDCLFRFNPA